MKVNKQPIQYLNIIKFISIFLVVFCHNPILKYNGILDNFFMLLCWICVPCFLLVNGALLLNKNLEIKKHYKKIAIIYISYVFWKIIYALISVHFFEFDYTQISIIKIFKYLFLFEKIDGINTDHLYFIEALLGIYIILPILHYNFRTIEGRKNLIILCIVLFLFTYAINAIDFTTNFILKNSMLSISSLDTIFIFDKYAHFLLFFILGGFLHIKEAQIKNIKGIRIISLILTILSLLGLCFIKYQINNTIRFEEKYLENGYNRLCTFIMSVSSFIFFQNISIKNRYIDKVINEISSNTLGIYYIHIPILWFLNADMLALRGISINTIKSLIIITIGYVLSKIIKKIQWLKIIV